MPPQRNRTAVLLVDDDEEVRAFLARLLRGQGYTVHTVCDGQEAAEVLEKGDHGVGILVTDLVMPRKNGMELIYLAKTIEPRLPVILMSGTFDDWQINREEIPCITKPFAIDALLQLMESQLPSKGTTELPPE